MHGNEMHVDHRTVDTPEADLYGEKGERRIAGCMRRKICVCMYVDHGRVGEFRAVLGALGAVGAHPRSLLRA